MTYEIEMMCEYGWSDFSLHPKQVTFYKKEIVLKDSCLSYMPNEMFKLIEYGEYDIVYYNYILIGA